MLAPFSQVPVYRGGSHSLMRESEVFPSAALVFGSLKIVQALYFSHGIPLRLTLAVEIHVEHLCDHVHANVHAGNPNKNSVSAAIYDYVSLVQLSNSRSRLTLRLVVLTVDIGVYDTSELDHHAVQLLASDVSPNERVTNLYNAAETARVRTELEFLLPQATCIAWATFY